MERDNESRIKKTILLVIPFILLAVAFSDPAPVNWKDESANITKVDILNGLSYDEVNADQQMTYQILKQIEERSGWINTTDNVHTIYNITADGNFTVTGNVTGKEAFFGDVTNYAQINGVGLSLNGTARVKQSRWVPFNALRAPGIKPAAYVDHGVAGAWEFSDGADDTLVANFQKPFDMDDSTSASFFIGWSSATADPGDDTKQAVWQVEYLWTSPDDDTTAIAQGTLTANVSASTVSEGFVITEISGIDPPSSTDACIHLRIKRLGDHTNDTLGDTAELHGMCIKYTANKLGEDTS